MLLAESETGCKREGAVCPPIRLVDWLVQPRSPAAHRAAPERLWVLGLAALRGNVGLHSLWQTFTATFPTVLEKPEALRY